MDPPVSVLEVHAHKTYHSLSEEEKQWVVRFAKEAYPAVVVCAKTRDVVAIASGVSGEYRVANTLNLMGVCIMQ